MRSQTGHNQAVAVLVGTQPPVTDVIHHVDDQDYTVLLTDAPANPDVLAPDDRRLRTSCAHCLIEQHPEVGRGLDLARRHGTASRDPRTGEWSAP